MTSQDRDHTSGRTIRPSFTPNGQMGNLIDVTICKTQSDIPSTLSKARATQNYVSFAKQSFNRKAFLVRTIFSPTKIFNNCHQKLFREHDQRCPRCEQGCKNEKLVTTKIFKSVCQRQTLFFVVVRTGSKTDTFGKSTIFSSFAAVQVFVKRGLTVYRLLITMIRIGNYFLTLFHGGGGEWGEGNSL